MDALQPGDLVRVRSKEDIRATLDHWNQRRGCAFLDEMWPYCGTQQRVFKRVERFLDERDYRISGDALDLFCSMVGDGLYEIHGELQKLLTYLGSRTLIDVADVQSVVSKGRAENIFELGNAVGRGDVGRALALASSLTDAGEAPLKILSLLVRHFRQLWKVRELQVQKRSPKEIAGTAGVPFFVIQPMIAQGKRFSRSNFYRAFELFLETDLAMKSSGADAEALLESLLLQLCRKK